MNVKIRDITLEQKNEYCKSHSCYNNCKLNPLCQLFIHKYLAKYLDFESAKSFLSNEYLEQEIEIKVDKPKLSKEAIVVLKLFDKKWKWIAKDKGGSFFAYTIKPRKGEIMWESYNECVCISNRLFNDAELWDFLSWEDEEPTNIEELIREHE